MDFIIQQLDKAILNSNPRYQNVSRFIFAVPLFQFLQKLNIAKPHIIPIYYKIAQWENTHQNCWELSPSAMLLLSRVYHECENVGFTRTFISKLLNEPRVQMITLIHNQQLEVCEIHKIIYSITLWQRVKATCDTSLKIEMVPKDAASQASSNHSRLFSNNLLNDLNSNYQIHKTSSLNNQFELCVCNVSNQQEAKQQQKRQCLEEKYLGRHQKTQKEEESQQEKRIAQQQWIESQKLVQIIDKWKLFVAHNQEVRARIIFSWVQKRNLQKYVISVWKNFVTTNHNLKRQTMCKWKCFCKHNRKRRARQQKKEQKVAKKRVEAKRHTLVAELCHRLQQCRIKCIAHKYFYKWVEFRKQRIHQRLVCQIVKQQWIEKLVYPARMINIQLERVLIQFLVKTISACVIQFYILLDRPAYTKAGISFVHDLLKMSKPKPELSHVLKMSRKLLKTPFIKTTMNYLDKNPILVKYNSTKQFFDDLLASLVRLSAGLSKIASYVPEQHQKQLMEHLLRPRYEIPIYQMLRWQRNCNAPRYITFIRDTEAQEGVLIWLRESHKKTKTVSVIDLLDSFLPQFLQGPDSDPVPLFRRNLNFWARKPVQLNYVQKNIH